MSSMSDVNGKNKKIQNQGDRVRVSTLNNEPERTQQHFKDECDVNQIVAKYKKTGAITHLARTKGVYADVSSITDYQQSLQKVLDAQSAFGTLPSDLRTRFGNDPSQLLQFLNDPKNFDEGVKLGLFDPKPETAGTLNKNDSNEKKQKPAKNQIKEHQLDLPQDEKS